MNTPKEITDLVNSSGNNFHAKVARWLSNNGWHVIVSPYYMDQVQNKAREIDLIAERLWPTTDVFGNRNGEIAIRLFVECKFVPSYSVFWFAEKDIAAARSLVCSTRYFRANNLYTDKHHYLSCGAQVAKLFATNAKKEHENEPFYKALNQALSAMTSMSQRPITIPELKQKKRRPCQVLNFPVVVCSSFKNMFGVDFYTDGDPGRIKDNFQLEIDYAYIEKSGDQKASYFLLDFVEFNQLEQYANVIGEDAEALAYLASEK